MLRALCRLLPCLLLAGCAGAPRWPVPAPEEERPVVDIVHYDIQVELDHRAGFVRGSVGVDVAGLPDRASDIVRLHAAELEITHVWSEDGDELEWELDAGLLTIHLPQTLQPGDSTSVSVDYEGFPRRGLFFVPPDAAEGGRPWHIWTQGQSVDTRHWVPVWDIPNDRATHELAITVDGDFVTMAAGELVDSRERRDGRRTDVWRMDTPHVSYLITLVAGGYAVGELEGGEVPLPVLAEREDLAFALQNFSETAAMLELFGEFTGAPYPYPKYAQSCVKEYTGGGMENISATTLYYRVIHDPADEPQVDSVPLLAHEAAHQWFGDLITCASWRDIWLNEGFADYLENVYLGSSRGGDWPALRRMTSQRSYLAAEMRNSRPVVWSGYEHPDDTFSSHVYPGGAARLHLLEHVLGPEAFLAGLRHYVEKHQGSLVDTGDFQVAMEESSGVDLDLFFEQWLHSPGVPVFQAVLAEDDRELMVTQRQSDDDWLAARYGRRKRHWRTVFDVPVTVAWSRDGVEHAERVRMDRREQRIPLGGAGDLDWVRFDADTALPAVVLLEQDEAQWRRQLRTAEDGLTRLIAAQWFSGDRWVRPLASSTWTPDSDSIEALVEAVDRDDFHRVRLEALQALTDTRNRRVETLLERCITDDDPRVRQAAARAFGVHGGDDGMPLLFDALQDANASVASAALRSLVARKSPAAFGELKRLYRETPLVKWRLHRDIVSLAAELDDDRALPFVMGAARTHPESSVRATAASRLGDYGGPHDDVVHRLLCELLNEASHKVRGAAARALARRGNPQAVTPLRARRSIEIDPYVLRSLDEALRILR